MIVSKMKLSHWDMLQSIYEIQVIGGKIHAIQCNKNLLKTCLKNGWIKYIDDVHVEVTEFGIDKAAEEFCELSKKTYGMQGTRM